MNPNTLKFVAILLLGLAFRLVPFRPPNVEPILASQMPFARQGGALPGFLFGALSILLYDIVTGTAGPWTLVTASVYGVLGLGAAWYFRSWLVTPSQSPPLKGGEGRVATRKHYVYFAIVGTLFYDAATGLTVGPLFFNQSFLAALTGQIPFTLMHLAGNIGFALTLSPIIERLLIQKSEIRISKSETRSRFKIQIV